MTEVYVHTPDIWLPLAAAIFLIALSQYGWRHRNVPAARPLGISSLFGALWMLGIAFEAAAVAPATKLIWHRFQAAWQLPTAIATTCFALEYAYPGRWLTRRNLALLSLPMLPSLLTIIIDNSQLLFRQLEVAADGSVVRHFSTLGLAWVAYGLSLSLVDMTAFLWLFVRSPQHRWPAGLMLFGDAAGRGFYGLYAFYPDRLRPLTLLDALVIALLLSWTLYSIALFGFRIFDPLPTARRAAFEGMREGMVVFDDRWHVASINPAAASILSVQATRAPGKTLHDLLPAFPDLIRRITGAADPPGGMLVVAGISLGTTPEARHYTLDVSLLKDFRGLVVGHLLLLHDVTEQRQAQAQLLTQQWAQATLQEREQLAHELHDGLSQSLAFLNLQAQTAQVYLRAGQGEAAQSSLTRLTEVSRELQGDVRELIGNLLAVSLPSAGFCSALRQAVARFEEQTGLTVVLDIAGEAEVVCSPAHLSPATGVQLLRIIQEALANVRKHAGAPDRVAIRLEGETGWLKLTITDNGAGFEPEQPSPGRRHFGLQVMRQRAERIGGQLTVQSSRGEGTRVELRVPLGGDAETRR